MSTLSAQIDQGRLSVIQRSVAIAVSAVLTFPSGTASLGQPFTEAAPPARADVRAS
jgi:hypothetical protein